MAKYITPANFRKEDANLLAALTEEAATAALTHAEATAVFDLLPSGPQGAATFKDFRDVWRYEYGNPYTTNSSTITGTNIAHKVSVLFRGLNILRAKLQPSQLREFCKRLDDKTKHLDYLSELGPIILIRPSEGFELEFERPACAGRTIDWHIKFNDTTSCLIDVKHRIKAFLAYAEGITQGTQAQEEILRTPADIFKSVEEKFEPAQAGCYQGVWIVSDIFYDGAALTELFAGLDSSKIQFAVVTGFEGQAQIITHGDPTTEWLKEKFCLTERHMKLREMPRAQSSVQRWRFLSVFIRVYLWFRSYFGGLL